MRPKKPETMGEGDLFRSRLDQIINLKHELVQLGANVVWDWIDRAVLRGSAQDRKPLRDRVHETIRPLPALPDNDSELSKVSSNGASVMVLWRTRRPLAR